MLLARSIKLGVTYAITLSGVLFFWEQASASGSASYSITSDTFNSASGAATNSAYANDGSLDGFGGVATANLNTAKHGYRAQLYDVTSLVLSANPTNINEGATRQISAFSTVDDGTILNYPGGGIAWMVLNGPIAAVNPGGLAQAGNVYQTTPAAVRGSYLGQSANLGLNIVNTVTDDFGLYGQDGIDDSWQVQYYGTNNPNGTGAKVLFAYTAGLNPTNPASVFSVSLAAAGVGQRQISFSPRLTNRTYTVQYSTNLAAGNYYPLSSLAQNDNGEVRTVTDLSATNTSRFYRVSITFP